jgi:uroporphyrinogen decarboxylase
MRQAGRYLPEYRELRKEAGSFLDLVYNPEKAAEVTVQPIRRYAMDGAILFSDILVVPHAMGQDVRFETGKGPLLNALRTREDFETLQVENPDKILSPIYETLKRTRQKLDSENFENVTLLGFAGAPWTVACYMVEGGTSRDFENIIDIQKNRPDDFQILIDRVSDVTIHYLKKQIEAGAEALQIFDSWASLLDGPNFDRWIINPTAKIIDAVKKAHPDVRIIGFPRGAGNNLARYAEQLPIDALGLDYEVSLPDVLEQIPDNIALQGNLDPHLLLGGGKNMESEIMNILDTLSSRRFIFNLGHGVIKETPPEHVEALSRIVKNYRH